MSNRPNEFPEGSDSGGGGRVFRPRPNPGEIPWEKRALQSVIMQEVLQLRDRVHSIESRLLVGRIGAGGGAAAFFNPAEFPEGGEGGGEIVEIADIGEIVEIAEFPRVSTLVNEVAQMRQQFASFEQRITAQIDELKQQIGKQR